MAQRKQSLRSQRAREPTGALVVCSICIARRGPGERAIDCAKAEQVHNNQINGLLCAFIIDGTSADRSNDDQCRWTINGPFARISRLSLVGKRLSRSNEAAD